MFIDFTKRKGEREKNIYVREKHRSVASHLHRNQGWNPQGFGVQDNAPTN